MPKKIPYELEDGTIIVAEACCDEKKDDEVYLVQWDDDGSGNVDYTLAHESCLEVVDEGD